MSLTTRLLTRGDCSPLTEPGSRSWAGMTRDSGSGAARTLSSHSRSGCVEAGACGYPAVESLMCTEGTRVHPADQVKNPLDKSKRLFH